MITRKMRLVVGALLIANLWVTTPLFGQDFESTHLPAPEELSDFERDTRLRKATQEYESAQEAKKNLTGRNEFMRGLYRGTDQLQATYQGGIGMVHSLLGNESEAAGSFARYQHEILQSSENPRLAPTFGSMIDDPFGWLAATAGEYALLTLFCTSIFAGVFFWISKQRSRHETERNNEKGIAMLDRKETFFWVRNVQNDKVVYTYKNYKIFYFCIFPLLILFTAIPVIGLIPVLGWIFYWGIYPRPNKEINQLLKEAECGATGSKFSAVNPMRLTFSRTDFDRIVMEREHITPATTRTSSAPTLPSTHSDNRSSDAEFESLKKKNEELKRKVEAKKLAEKQAKDKAALEAENARLMAELGEGMEVKSEATELGKIRP